MRAVHPSNLAQMSFLSHSIGKCVGDFLLQHTNSYILMSLKPCKDLGCSEMRDDSGKEKSKLR